jgi:hypothetical protein
MFSAGMNIARDVVNCWGAEAASLPVAAACRDHFARTARLPYLVEISRATGVSGKLPETAGWQHALPGLRRATRFPRS